MVTRKSSDTGLPVLGSRIQKLRELLHLSKTQFAIRIGYTSSQITRDENGDSAISTELCDRIVSTYGVRKEWLCGDEGEPWIDGKLNRKSTGPENAFGMSIWKVDLANGSSASVWAVELCG